MENITKDKEKLVVQGSKGNQSLEKLDKKFLVPRTEKKTPADRQSDDKLVVAIDRQAAT